MQASDIEYILKKSKTAYNSDFSKRLNPIG